MTKHGAYVKRITQCVHCGQLASEHHEHSAVSMPAGCHCDPKTWDDEFVRPICAHYAGEGLQYCPTCAHDKECHGNA